MFLQDGTDENQGAAVTPDEGQENTSEEKRDEVAPSEEAGM